MAQDTLKHMYALADFDQAKAPNNDDPRVDSLGLAHAFGVSVHTGQLLAELYKLVDRLIAWYDRSEGWIAHYNNSTCRYAHLVRGAIANHDADKLRVVHAEMSSRCLRFMRGGPSYAADLNDDFRITRALALVLTELPASSDELDFERSCFSY